jgi:hypothetical protein
MSCSTCKHEKLKAKEHPCKECDWEYMNKYEPKKEEGGEVKDE